MSEQLIAAIDELMGRGMDNHEFAACAGKALRDIRAHLFAAAGARPAPGERDLSVPLAVLRQHIYASDEYARLESLNDLDRGIARGMRSVLLMAEELSALPGAAASGREDDELRAAAVLAMEACRTNLAKAAYKDEIVLLEAFKALDAALRARSAPRPGGEAAEPPHTLSCAAWKTGAESSCNCRAREWPDVEDVSRMVHDAWVIQKRAGGVHSRRSEAGEELMVPYDALSEPAKELDRATVLAVYAAMDRFALAAASGDTEASHE